MKKVQPKGVGLRCEIHRRNGGQATAEGWEWEDAWDRLPADMRLKVAAIDVDALEAAMHQATSTHRCVCVCVYVCVCVCVCVRRWVGVTLSSWQHRPVAGSSCNQPGQSEA